MSKSPLDDSGWEHWRKTQNCIDRISATMQQLVPIVSEYPPIPVPPRIVADIRKEIARFEERFSHLVHEQRRKAKK